MRSRWGRRGLDDCTMQLTPDSTIIIQIILFIGLWMGLQRLFFGPMRVVLDAREKSTTAAQAEAVHLQADAETERHTYENGLRDMRAELAQASTAARNAAAEQQAKVLAEARAAAGDKLGQLRLSLAEQVAAARLTLAADADGIAREMLDSATRGAHA